MSFRLTFFLLFSSVFFFSFSLFFLFSFFFFFSLDLGICFFGLNWFTISYNISVFFFLSRLGGYPLRTLFLFFFLIFSFSCSCSFSFSYLHRQLSSSCWLPVGYQLVTIWLSVMIKLTVVSGGWRVGEIIPSWQLSALPL